MLSSSFSEFEISEAPEPEESLEESFENLMVEGLHGIRHIGPVLFWILNENLPEQKRIGYAEEFFIKIVEADFYLDKFIIALRHLSSGRYGGNSQTILESILTHGKVKDLLDSKTDAGIDGNNYKLFGLRELSSYFADRYIYMLNTAVDKIIDGDTGYRVSQSFNSATAGIALLEPSLKETIFNSVVDKLNGLTVYFESNSYVYNKETIIMGILDTFESLLDESITERLNKTLIDTGSVMPEGARGTELYVKEVKASIQNGDLSRLYNSLNIGEHLSRYEKSIIINTLESAKGSDDLESFEENFVYTFFYKDLNEKFPDLTDHIVEAIAEKLPSKFLGITYGYRIPSEILEQYQDKYSDIAYRGLLVVSPNEFANLLRDGDADGKQIESLRQILRENIVDDVVLLQIDPKKLASSFSYFLEELEEEGQKKVFNSMLNRMDKETCSALGDSLYSMDSDELKAEFAKEFIAKIEENIALHYRCFLDNSYKFSSYLERGERRRLEGKALEVVIENKDSVTYFDHFYSNYSTGSRYALIPEPFRHALKRLEKVDNYKEALDIHGQSHNDIDVEVIPESRIKYSGYQNQQRPAELVDADIDRYELTQDNTEPTPIMYDINKNNIRAADFVGHTNLGSSGFTSAWALTSFPEDKLLIEQIQSDYPVVLDRVFNRMPPTKKSYRAIEYKNRTGAKFTLGYKDDEGGVYIAYKEGSEGLLSEVDPEIAERLDDEGLMDIMSSEEFYEYIEKAKEYDRISGSYNSSESEKAEAYSKASDIYRDRAREIRRRLDGYGLIPASLYSLNERYSEEEIRDAKKHIEIISQNYSYLIIVNAMKTAQKMGMDSVYLLKSGGSSIQNLNKRRKIYKELPEALEAEDDTVLGLQVFKLPANRESIERVRSLMPIRKKGGYNYSLTPSQNGTIISKRREEQRGLRRLDREKQDTELSRDKYLEGERLIKEVFHEAGLPYTGPEQDTITGLLRYLGGSEAALKQGGISKGRLKNLKAKIVNLRFAEIIEEYGLTKFGLQKIIPLYNLLIKNNMMNEAEELQILVDNVSVDKNLLLEKI